MPSLVGTTVAANYLKAENPFSRFGTPDLIFLKITGLTGVGGEGGGSGWVGDLDMDLLIEAKGTTAKSEALALNVWESLQAS